MDDYQQRAFALLTSDLTRRAFDLSREPLKSREAYGHTSFGQSCLLGRRLVEAGVPYVQVNWSQYVEVFYTLSDYGWDTHADNFGLMAEWHGPLLDRVLATLLEDLGRRGPITEFLEEPIREHVREARLGCVADELARRALI